MLASSVDVSRTWDGVSYVCQCHAENQLKFTVSSFPIYYATRFLFPDRPSTRTPTQRQPDQATTRLHRSEVPPQPTSTLRSHGRPPIVYPLPLAGRPLLLTPSKPKGVNAHVLRPMPVASVEPALQYCQSQSLIFPCGDCLWPGLTGALLALS